MTPLPELITTQEAADVVGRTIGLNVHQMLFLQRRTQLSLARALGIDASVLSKKLRGEVTWSAQQITDTAEFLGVEPGRLFQAPSE